MVGPLFQDVRYVRAFVIILANFSFLDLPRPPDPPQVMLATAARSKATKDQDALLLMLGIPAYTILGLHTLSQKLEILTTTCG